VRTIATFVVTLALLGACVPPARAGVAINPNAISRPDAKGDQVIFYYDARATFTTFINLNNGAPGDETVQVLFYGPGFSEPFVRTVTVPGNGMTIIDVGALKSGTPPTLPAQFGVAIATAINGEGKTVVSRSLSGNFTVANLQVQSAWGASGAARTAIFSGALAEHHTSPRLGVEAISSTPNIGDVIDGSTVILPPIQPLNAYLAAYYNPDTLAPADQGGNQLIFVSFEDVAGQTYSATSISTNWNVDATTGAGVAIPEASFLVNGVAVSDVVSVVGAGASGASGWITFNAPASGDPVSRFVYFTETLGTFATGYLLPPTVAAPLL
jgi:hypothetical protein